MFTPVKTLSVGSSGYFVWKTERRYGKVLQAETALEPQVAVSIPLLRR